MAFYYIQGLDFQLQVLGLVGLVSEVDVYNGSLLWQDRSQEVE